MTGRRGPKARPPRSAIVVANSALLARLGLSAGQADSVCWACGILCKDSGPTRAHVVARCHGGSDDPENFILLCDHCHEEQPDGAPRVEQERWLLTAPSWDEWSGRAVDDVMDKVNAGARRHGLADADVMRWLGGLSFEELSDLIAHGYRSAGSHANGRGNCAAHLLTTFLQAASAVRESA